MNAATTKDIGLRSIVATLLAAMVLAARGAISPLDPGFSVQSWDAEAGLPNSPIRALARTPDGYLWLATSAGLVRFDGTRFITLTTNTTPALGDSHIASLLADTNGALWIGTQNGTLAWRRARTFVQIPLDPRLRGVPINSLKAARGGGMWLATSGCGLVLFKDGACDFSTPTNGLKGAAVTSVAREETGRLWVVSGSRLVTLERGRWQVASGGPNESTPTYAVAAGQGDATWIATASENPFRDRGGRVFQFEGGQSFWELTPYPWSQDSRRTGIRSVLEDHEGRVWVGTVADGVSFWTRGLGWQRLASEAVQSIERVSAMMEDAEGLIWLADSRGSLYQVQARRVASVRLSAAAAGVRAVSVCASPDGSVWIGTDDAGVFRFANDGVTQITNGLSSSHVYSVYADSRTNIWVGTLNGLYRWQSTRFAERALPGTSTPAVAALYEDHRGNLWAGTSEGMVRIAPDGETALFAEAAGLNHFFFRALAEDSHGRLWVAVGDRGLYQLRGARFEEFGSDRWPGAMDICSLQADADGGLWIATGSKGLFWCKDGVFRQWTERDGLPEMRLSGMIPDNRGNLWFGSPNGIFGCQTAALAADHSGRNWPLLFWRLSVEDGLDNKDCAVTGQPVQARSADGRLWFPNRRAVAVFDPARVSRLGRALAPVAEEVVADGTLRKPDVTGVFWLRSDRRRRRPEV